MSKSVSNSLKELKPLLPRGYQGKILKSLPDVSLSKIKKAFSGHSVSEEIMCRIFSEAMKLSKDHIKSQLGAKAATKALKKLAAKAE